MTSQQTPEYNEPNNKDELRTLEQQIQELWEKVLLLQEENENLRLNVVSKKWTHKKSEGAQSLPDQTTLTACQSASIQQPAKESKEQSYKKSEGAECLTDQNSSSYKSSCTTQAVSGPRKKYKKTSSAANMEGELYEIMMASVIYSRCQARDTNFLLAANMEIAVPLDDIVLSLGNNVVFIQLKHFSAKGKTIYDSMFLQLVSDFSLMKYFKAYLNIKKNWNKSADLRSCGEFNNAVFVLYTNARMAEKVNAETLASQTDETSDWQSIISTGGKCVQVSRESHPHYYKFFESLPKDREILLGSRDGENENELLDVVRRLQNFNAKIPPNAAERQKLLKDMVLMEELPEYEHFLSRLWIFTGQMNCQKLHSCIKKELSDLWNSCHKKTDSISIQFMTRMQTWWREESYFLNGNTEFWYEMITILAEKMSEEKMKEIEGLGIKFDKEELNKIRGIIEGCKSVVHIASISSVMMTTLKVYQALGGNCVLVGLTTLQERATEIMLLWRWCSVLVVVMDTEENAAVLPETGPGKTLIIVSKDMNSEAYDYRDNFSIEQLDGCSRAQVLSLPIKFQGNEISLWDLLGSDSKLNIAINGDLILEMLKGNKLSLGNELPELPEFYVPRALILKCAVKRDILTAQISATLAISGIDENGIVEIKPDEESSTSSDKVITLAVQDEEEFNKIKGQHQNIHWLHYENDVLYWRKSEGDISFIRKFLEEENSFVYKNVSTVDDIEGSVVILSAEPGMGKSTLLINVARNTKSSKDSSLVLRVNLLDCINELQKLPLNLNIEHVHRFLLSVSHTLELGGIFSARLFNMDNVYLFFDGYDEISPDYSDKVSQILKLVKDNNPRKLFVTTRPVMRQTLEHNLSTLAYTLEPFSVEDQENVLKKTWGALSSDCHPEVLQWFVSEISTLSKSINENNLLGIPLQTMILAEIFADKFLTLANTGKVSLPNSLDPLYIFEQFVDRKFNIYWQKNGIDLSIPSLKENYKTLKKDFLETHMLCAVIVINPFMEVKGESSTKLHEIINKIAEGREKTGLIMDIVDGIPVFVHRMFAEYFAALWFAENYKEYKSIVKTIHVDLTYSVVLDIFNRELAKSCDLHIAVLNMDTDVILAKVTENPDLVNAIDKGGRSPLHLAILNCKNCTEDSQQSVIVKILLSIEVIDLKCDKVLGMNPAEYADMLEISWLKNSLTARAERAMKNVPNQVVDVLQPVRSVVPSEIRGLIDALDWLREQINNMN